MNLLNTLEGPCGCETTKQAESPSILDRLKRQQLELKERLSDVNDAVAALEQNPAVAKVLELLVRVR